MVEYKYLMQYFKYNLLGRSFSSYFRRLQADVCATPQEDLKNSEQLRRAQIQDFTLTFRRLTTRI